MSICATINNDMRGVFFFLFSFRMHKWKILFLFRHHYSSVHCMQNMDSVQFKFNPSYNLFVSFHDVSCHFMSNICVWIHLIASPSEYMWQIIEINTIICVMNFVFVIQKHFYSLNVFNVWPTNWIEIVYRFSNQVYPWFQAQQLILIAAIILPVLISSQLR